MLDEFLIQLFYEGQCLEAYKVFGAHLCKEDDVNGVRFTMNGIDTSVAVHSCKPAE